MALLKIRDSVNPNLWHIVPAKIIGDHTGDSDYGVDLIATDLLNYYYRIED